MRQPDLDVDRIMEKGSVRFRPDMLLIMSANEAYVVAYLLDRPADETGWFQCKGRTTTNDLYMSPSQQSQVLHGLREKGYIDIERRGVRANRWVRINREKLWADVAAALAEWKAERGNTQ